jgi:hypothetical protein
VRTSSTHTNADGFRKRLELECIFLYIIKRLIKIQEPSLALSPQQGMRVGNRKRFVYSRLICQLVAVLSVIGIIATTLALYQQVRAYPLVFQYYLGSTYGWGTYTGTPPTYSSALFYDRFCYHLVIPTSSALQDLCTDFPPYTTGLVVLSLLLFAAIASYLVLRRKKSKRV